MPRLWTGECNHADSLGMTEEGILESPRRLVESVTATTYSWMLPVVTMENTLANMAGPIID